MGNQLTIFSSLSGCYGFVVYGFWFIWSKLGYATISCRASSLLARLVCSSSIWEYMENHLPLLNVVSLEGKK